MVNPETQSDEWVVNFKSWVVNYTWYDIQTEILLELSILEMQILRVSFSANFRMSSKLIIPLM